MISTCQHAQRMLDRFGLERIQALGLDPSSHRITNEGWIEPIPAAGPGGE